jgi:hypothetical protein
MGDCVGEYAAANHFFFSRLFRHELEGTQGYKLNTAQQQAKRTHVALFCFLLPTQLRVVRNLI